MIPRPREDESWAQRALVHWNFLRVVLPQFKLSISVFLIANLVGAVILWADPALTDAQGDPLTFIHAAYTALALNFFEVADDFPQDGYLITQAVFFLLPAIGLLVVAEGLIRLGVAIMNRKRNSEEWNMALAKSYTDHVVIAGLGRIGSRVATRLQDEERLVCIEPNKEHTEHVELSENVAIIHGDATSPPVLEEANVSKARAILVLTDNDLANLEIALAARELNSEIRVVLRMFNESLGQRLIEAFDFQAVYSTSSLAAPSFSSAIYSNRILQTIQVSEEKAVHMARLLVKPASSLVGKSILEVEVEAQVSVILHHTEGSKALLPSAEATVRKGDELFVLAELKALDTCDRLASGGGAAST